MVGGAATELFSAIITPPLARRRDAWISSIAEGLRALEQTVEGFKIEALADNEVFTTAVMHATQAALRDHRHEKLEALRNAVLNVAAGKAPSDDLQLMFLNFIDTATSWHIQWLAFLHNPQEYARRQNAPSPGPSVAPASIPSFKDLKDQNAFVEQLIRDLSTSGFVGIDPAIGCTLMESTTSVGKLTTELGDIFLRFIESPLQQIH